MRNPMIQTVMLALMFLSSACDNAKFNGTGKKKDRKESDQTAVIIPPASDCKEGEACVPVDPGPCKAGDKGCPIDGNPPVVVPPKDECKVGEVSKNCPTPPPVDCDDPSQNPNQNSEDTQECPSDDAGQNPGQGK